MVEISNLLKSLLKILDNIFYSIERAFSNPQILIYFAGKFSYCFKCFYFSLEASFVIRLICNLQTHILFFQNSNTCWWKELFLAGGTCLKNSYLLRQEIDGYYMEYQNMERF